MFIPHPHQKELKKVFKSNITCKKKYTGIRISTCLTVGLKLGCGSVVQSLVTSDSLWPHEQQHAGQAPLSFTVSWSLLKFVSIWSHHYISMKFWPVSTQAIPCPGTGPIHGMVDLQLSLHECQGRIHLCSKPSSQGWCLSVRKRGLCMAGDSPFKKASITVINSNWSCLLHIFLFSECVLGFSILLVMNENTLYSRMSKVKQQKQKVKELQKPRSKAVWNFKAYIFSLLFLAAGNCEAHKNPQEVGKISHYQFSSNVGAF